MKKKLLVLLVLASLGTALFAAGQFTLTPKVGYAVLDFDAEVKVDDGNGSTKTMKEAVVSKGMSFGLDLAFLINPKLSIYFDGEYVLPFHAAYYTRDDGRMVGGTFNKKYFTNNYDSVKWFGYKFNLGVMYNLLDTGRMKASVGGGIGLHGMKVEGTSKVSSVKSELTSFGIGLAVKASGSYAFSEKVAMFASFEPDLLLYSRIETKESGTKLTKYSDGGICFRFAPSTSIGCSFTF